MVPYKGPVLMDGGPSDVSEPPSISAIAMKLSRKIRRDLAIYQTKYPYWQWTCI